MPAPPFLIPVSIVVAGVEHAGTYVVVDGRLTVHYGEDEMTVEPGEAHPKRRAEEVLRALVKRRPRR